MEVRSSMKRNPCFQSEDWITLLIPVHWLKTFAVMLCSAPYRKLTVIRFFVLEGFLVSYLLANKIPVQITSFTFSSPHSRHIETHNTLNGRDKSTRLSSPWLKWIQLLSNRAHQSPGFLWKYAGICRAHSAWKSRAQPRETAATWPRPRWFPSRTTQKRISRGPWIQRNNPKYWTCNWRGDIPRTNLSGIKWELFR